MAKSVTVSLNSIVANEYTSYSSICVKVNTNCLMALDLLKMIGEPSTQLMKEMGDEEKERIAKQIERLGESGLRKKTDTLEKATEDNEVG